jgi:ATP-dependent helicase YprA (DUF1998 family)
MTEDGTTEMIDVESTVFDEEVFFASPTFSKQVFEEVRAHVYSQLEEPFNRLEKGGHVPYLNFLKERGENNRFMSWKGKIVEGEMIQKSLEDALIQGDPREYQRKLLEVAKTSNTIVHLPTGAGKTLIALLCIKEGLTSERNKDKNSDNKQTLFLVPSVALAIQQSLTLRANLPNFRIETACYATASSKGARDSLAECDIIVGTHGAVSEKM